MKETTTLRIEGMSCTHCVRAVREALDGLEGVRVADVQIGEARVEYDADRVKPVDLEAAVREAGYEPAVS